MNFHIVVKQSNCIMNQKCYGCNMFECQTLLAAGSNQIRFNGQKKEQKRKKRKETMSLQMAFS